MSTSEGQKGGSGSDGREKMMEKDKGGLFPGTLGLNPVSYFFSANQLTFILEEKAAGWGDRNISDVIQTGALVPPEVPHRHWNTPFGSVTYGAPSQNCAMLPLLPLQVLSPPHPDSPTSHSYTSHQAEGQAVSYLTSSRIKPPRSQEEASSQSLFLPGH